MTKGLNRSIRAYLCAMIAALMTVILCVAPVSAANATADSKVSSYTCDFEGNYHSSVSGGSIESSGSGNALKFNVDSNSSTHHFEIYNSNSGNLTLTNGNVYAVTVSYKVDNISAEVESEINTTINLVRYNGSSDTLVKIKTFPNAAFAPGDTTGWVTATIVFKASIADSPEYNRLAINVVSPSCPSTATKVEKNITTIWFDDITVTECVGTTSTLDFQSNGGSHCDVLMAQPGETVTLPTPTRELYDFAGWYTDSSLTDAYTKSTMPSGLITKLYAKWEVSASSIKVEFTDAYDSSVNMLVGKAGDALTLPVPTRTYFHFAGWYKDAELTEKFEASVFPNESVMLYAKWEAIPFFCGFENADTYGQPNDGSFTKRCNITEEDKYYGDKAVFYDFEQGSHTDRPNAYRALATIILINEHGEKFASIPGEEYVMTFKYKITEVTKPGSFGVIASAEGSAWSHRATVIDSYSDDSVDYDEEDVGKDWQTGSIRFVSTSENNNPEFAFIGIGIAGHAKLYVDNVVLHKVDSKAEYNDKCMMTFESNGGNYCETVYGDLGEEIVMPADPTREGYRFMGWYTDKECNAMFDKTTFENGYVHLYADWYLIPVVEEPAEQPVADVVPTEPEEKESGMSIYIIIGVVAVVVIAAVVAVIVVLGKKKKGTADKEGNGEKDDEKDKK